MPKPFLQIKFELVKDCTKENLLLSIFHTCAHARTHTHTHTHTLWFYKCPMHTFGNPDALKHQKVLWMTGLSQSFTHCEPPRPPPWLFFPVERDWQKQRATEGWEREWRHKCGTDLTDILNLPVRMVSGGSCTLLAQRREVSGMLSGRYQGEDDRTAVCPEKKENLRRLHLLQNILLISATGKTKHPENKISQLGPAG